MTAPATVADLRTLRELQDLPQELLEWLIANGDVIEARAGERLVNPGEAVDHMWGLLSGATQVFFEIGGQMLLFETFGVGRLSGVLPYSRLTHLKGCLNALEDCRIFRLHRRHFPEMLQRSPELGQRLVGAMTDRVRDALRTQLQREKIVALGTLSAGLAHELNNPAAAMRRSASGLAERLDALPGLVLELLKQGADESTLLAARAVLARVRQRPAATLSALTRTTREDEIADWLEKHGVTKAWQYSETLLEAGFVIADLEELAVGRALPAVVAWLAATLDTAHLSREIGSAAGRISDLVASVKSYSHLDKSAERQPTDVRSGIDSTLIMLGQQLGAKQVKVARRDAPDLPLVQAHAGELNQVWTNLIDNAVHALPPGGQLEVETAREGEHVVVRVIDDGSGIAQEVMPRVFEPFFTTRGVGQGIGLGLDIVQRIVRQHEGEVRAESKPGRTTFTVRLPVAR